MSEISDDVSATIDAYAPVGVDQWRWRLVRQFVKDVVRRTFPQSASIARLSLGQITRLSAWAHCELGLDLIVSAILDQRIIDRYVAVNYGSASADSQRRLAQRLSRLAATVMRSSRTPSKRPNGSPLARPYSTHEVTQIVGWAQSRPTLQHRQNATALLALALGGGLQFRELISIRGRDIISENGLLFAHVGGAHSRRVPIRRLWAEPLHTVLRTLEPDSYVLQSDIDRELDAYTTAMVIFGRGTQLHKPSPQRLRSTWIVGLLTENVPVQSVLEVAGLKVANSLERYFPFVPPTKDVAQLIAGPVGTA